jgi:hypothetical protein
MPTYYTVQVVDSALSSIFNQIDAATASASASPTQHVAKEEEEAVPKNRHDLVTVAPQTLVQQPAEERRHHRPLRRQASLSKSAVAVKTTGLKQNGTVALGQRGVSDASAVAGTIQPLADDTASKIEKSAVPVQNKKTLERRQLEREGTITGHKFIVKSLASEDSKYITVSTDAAATDETKDTKDLQHGEVAKNAKTEKTSSKDINGYFGSWSGVLFNNKEQRSNGDTTFHVYSAVEAETDKIKVGWQMALCLRISYFYSWIFSKCLQICTHNIKGLSNEKRGNLKVEAFGRSPFKGTVA